MMWGAGIYGTVAYAGHWRSRLAIFSHIGRVFLTHASTYVLALVDTLAATVTLRDALVGNSTVADTSSAITVTDRASNDVTITEL
jgi:hypothetical protein